MQYTRLDSEWEADAHARALAPAAPSSSRAEEAGERRRKGKGGLPAPQSVTPPPRPLATPPQLRCHPASAGACRLSWSPTQVITEITDESAARAEGRRGKGGGHAPGGGAGEAPGRRKGQVVIRGLSLRYKAHSPLVLKSVSMSIEGGSKVAICGRTGCGKSSLFAALARLYPVAKGSVVVDGVDLVQVRLSLSRMPTDADVCCRNTDVCSRMLTYAHVWSGPRPGASQARMCFGIR